MSDPWTWLPVRDAIHVLADDIDGDGRVDLAFVSHGGNFLQVFYQGPERQFFPGPELSVTGFHPNDMIRLPGPGRLYLLNAEGDQALRMLAPSADREFRVVARTPLSAPRSTLPFSWPGWAMGLAVLRYGGGRVILLKGFDPHTGDVEGRARVRIWGGTEHLVAADLDGDKVDELLGATPHRNTVWYIRAPKEGERPTAELLWRFPSGTPREVTAVDINEDGALDVVVGQATEPRIDVLLNDGHGNFHQGESIDYPVKPGIHFITSARDKDGTLYLAAGGAGALVLYRGKGGVEFEQAMLRLRTWPRYIVLQDIDGDGWLDLAAAMMGGDEDPVVFGPLRNSFKELARTRSGPN